MTDLPVDKDHDYYPIYVWDRLHCSWSKEIYKVMDYEGNVVSIRNSNICTTIKELKNHYDVAVEKITN